MADNNSKSIRALISALKSKGYVVYDKPYQLNIVGVRKNSTVSNVFNDKIYVFWKDDTGNWKGKEWNITTDPGTYYLKNPLSKLGAAILKEGQYVDSYSIGKHRGLYNALVQSKPVIVFRDYDRNAILDYNNGREETGNFGINIHKRSKPSDDDDTWSAGCQVFENQDNFNEFMDLAQKHKSLYGNKFTYSLIDERSYNRFLKKIGVYIGIALIGVVAVWVGYRTYKKQPITLKF